MSDHVERFPGPVIPPAQSLGSPAISLGHGAPLAPGNLRAIERLREEFMAAGVLERPVEQRKEQSAEELEALVRDAAARAKYERELNPEYYDRELDESLRGDAAPEEDWANPFLGEGNNSLSAGVAPSRDDITETPQVVTVDFGGGRVVKAKIIEGGNG